jgi:prefoldin beta subunit
MTDEQQLQHILFQRQQFSAQLLEIESALEELKEAKTAYKIVGNIMVGATPTDLVKDLEERKELIALRLKSIDKQEEQFHKGSKDE